MQHLIPFRSVIMLIMVMISYGEVHWKKSANLLPWIIKAILLEPFRLLESIYVEIRRHGIKKQPPIFILGYYRSGTTWLQELMSCDPDLRTPTIFQTVLPEFMFILEPVFKPLLQFFSETFQINNPYHRLNFNWDFPGEEDVAINALFYRCDFNRIFQYPSHADQILNSHFLKTDTAVQEKWGRAHSYFTDKLSLKYPGKRLVLKSPPNTGRIALLKSIYPDARFIFIKREPYACLQSNKRLWAINKSFSFEYYSEDLAERVTLKMYEIFHERYKKEKSSLKSGELVEVTYEELIENPGDLLDRIYETLTIHNNDQKRKLRQNLIDKRSDYQLINHKLSELTFNDKQKTIS